MITREMVDLLSLDLVDKGLETDQLTLTVGYDIENLTRPDIHYQGEVVTDPYGRKIPRHAHGTVNFSHTASTRLLTEGVMELFDRIVDPNLLVRRLTLNANHILPEGMAEPAYAQTDLFGLLEEQTAQKNSCQREKRRQKAILHLQKRYGKNVILKAMNLQKGATAMERNRQIGGHKA